MFPTTQINKAVDCTIKKGPKPDGTVGQKHNSHNISQSNQLPYSISFDSAARQIQLLNHSFKKKFSQVRDQ